MYNAEQKTRFVKETIEAVTVREAALNLFNKTEPYEEEYGGDIVTMDVESLQRVFDRLAGLRDKTKYKSMHILQSYARWAIGSGIPDAKDSALRLESAGIERMRTETVRNPKQLQIYLDALFLPESLQTADNNFRSWYWLAFAGLKAEDALTVTVDEVDFTRMMISHNSALYPICREAVPALHNCVTLSQFRFIHPNYGGPNGTLRDRAPGRELLRGLRGVPALQTFRVEFVKRLAEASKEGKTQMHLSYRNVWLSGFFFRMYEDELAGIEPDFGIITEARLGSKQFKLDSCRNTQESKKAELSREFQKDYERWKQTLLP